MYACKYTRDSGVNITYIFLDDEPVFLHAQTQDDHHTNCTITTEYDADCDLKNREFINFPVNEVSLLCKIDCLKILFTKDFRWVNPTITLF